MAGKTRIVGELGARELLLPGLVNDALTANDRAKYLMTLLQTAKEHGDHPDQPPTDLRQERLACDVADSAFDSVVERCRKDGDNVYALPEARRIHEQLVASVRQMLAPLETAESEQRLEALLAQIPPPEDDHFSSAAIDRITSGQRGAQDSLHLLVMDLHRELNRLQQTIATEAIDGAKVYGVQEEDRPLIAAFMAGVNQTSALKFNHPGLGTTATRAGGRLAIQNDIGLTEAHVLVVHVDAARAAATLTYSDIHLQRVLFFQGLFERFGVSWRDTHSRRSTALEGELYHLCLGTYRASDPAALVDFLRFLGSRLVFLIDWNRARKRLRKFAPKRVCLEVLRWAADENYGHRGFLELGGEQLLLDALQLSARPLLLSAPQLSDVLGPEKVAEFFKFTLRTAAEGLLAGRSEFLIRDEISAELRHFLETAHQGFLDLAAEHAGLIVELAMAARDSLLPAPLTPTPLPRGERGDNVFSPLPSGERGRGEGAGDRGYVARAARRAKKWEHAADELVNQGRRARSRWSNGQQIPDLLGIADNAADELEDAVFLLSLLPAEGFVADWIVALHDLAGLLVQGAQEHLKAVANARLVHRRSPREQVEDFLGAVDAMLRVEHQADDAHRRARAGILTFSGDFKQLHIFTAVADNLEDAADDLTRSVLTLRDYILGEVMTR